MCQNFKTYQYLPFFLEKKPTLICKKNLPFLKKTDQKPIIHKIKTYQMENTDQKPTIFAQMVG